MKLHFGHTEKKLIELTKVEIELLRNTISTINTEFDIISKDIILESLSEIEEEKEINVGRLNSAILQLKEDFCFDKKFKKEKKILNSLLKKIDKKNLTLKIMLPLLNDYRTGLEPVLEKACSTLLSAQNGTLTTNRFSLYEESRAYHLHRNYEEIELIFTISESNMKMLEQLRNDYYKTCKILDSKWITETENYIHQKGIYLNEKELPEFKRLFNAHKDFYEENFGEIAFYQLSLIDSTESVLDETYHNNLLKELEEKMDCDDRLSKISEIVLEYINAHNLAH